MLPLEHCAWHSFASILVSELKEFKDIDYLIITFFASSLKIVNSLFHSQPCPQGDDSRIVMKLKSIDWSC